MNEGRIGIREMTADDIPPVMEIERECFPSPWTENMFSCQLALGDAAVNLVAVDGGGITGYLAAWFGYEEIHILSLAVTASCRGGGCAEALLREAVGCARRARCLRAVLEVRAGNERAKRFYEKNGFVRVGTRRGYYRDTGEDALLYERKLEREEDNG